MTISDQLAQSYLQDTRRMIAAARAALDCVPVGIDSLLTEIHTLKGTSTMVPHSAAQSCVGVLHLIEIKITERPEEPDSWSGLVREVLLLCEKEISQISRASSQSFSQSFSQSSLQAPSQQAPVTQPAASVSATAIPHSSIRLKGVLARVVFHGQSCLGELLWFPLKEISDVQVWRGLQERTFARDLPLLGATEPAWEHTALTCRVQTEEGALTLIVKEFVGLCNWKTALQHSAQAGVPFLLEHWNEISTGDAANQYYRLQKEQMTLSAAAAS